MRMSEPNLRDRFDIKPWIGMYLWLCRCYGPYSFRQLEFNYWVRYFFSQDANPVSILNSLMMDGWISQTNDEVLLTNCREIEDRLALISRV